MLEKKNKLMMNSKESVINMYVEKKKISLKTTIKEKTHKVIKIKSVFMVIKESLLIFNIKRSKMDQNEYTQKIYFHEFSKPKKKQCRKLEHP